MVVQQKTLHFFGYCGGKGKSKQTWFSQILIKIMPFLSLSLLLGSSKNRLMSLMLHTIKHRPGTKAGKYPTFSLINQETQAVGGCFPAVSNGVASGECQRLLELRSNQIGCLNREQRLRLKGDGRHCPRIKYQCRASDSVYAGFMWW